MNTVKTALLLGILTVLLVWIGGAIGGKEGATFAFIFALLLNFGSYWYSDKIVLALYRAKEVDPQRGRYLYGLLRELTERASLPMPKLYIIPSSSPNAFATGRNPEHACVAITEGLLDLLSEEELKGVLAHELSHVKNRDTLISTIAATIAGAITMLASWAKWAAVFGGMGRYGDDDDSAGGGPLGLLLLAIIAPLAALIIQLAISRTREYMADSAGAGMVRSPWGLARALEKLQRASLSRPLHASPSTAHLFIVNPFKGGDFITSLFSTHPPLEERIKRLTEIGKA